MRRVCRVTCLLTALLATACWRSQPSAPPFDVVRTSPVFGGESEPLMLNDSVTVYFSAAVNPVSVTAHSVTVLDELGHPVPGSLRAGPTWVTFVPNPPLSADLADGSFRPGATYRLVVAGYPRPDAIRASDGRRLAAAHSYTMRTATREAPGHGLPAPLRPPDTGLPFLLRPWTALQVLPADAPRLRLHFTLPVLPSTATAAAFRIQRMRPTSEDLLPRSIRVVTSRLDEYPGSTVEIDLGTTPRVLGSNASVQLATDDWIGVTVQGSVLLTDLGGNPVLPPAAQCWRVVAGTSIALVEWPAAGDDGGIVGDDPLLPGFEAVSGTIRPRLRVEAGDGSLGVFRPRRDTVLRPGEPFDRGDGTLVVSRGPVFPFLAIDVPAGVTVRVDGGTAPMRLLSCGGIRIDGVLELAAATTVLPPLAHGSAVNDLLDVAPVALLAAGDIWFGGRVVVGAPLPSDHTALTLASAGRFHLLGTLPYNTVLAVEATTTPLNAPAIVGSRGQSVLTFATFTFGLAAGGAIAVQGGSPWRQLPFDRDGGVLHLTDVDANLRVGWQQAPADPVRKADPDLRPDRVGRVETANDLERISFVGGDWVRFMIEAEVAADRPLPMLRDLRISDR
jgi:hypothetical protein